MPIHGGYSFLGYATAGTVFGFLSRTGLYVAFGLLGLMYTLWTCLTTTPGNLTRFWIYLGTVFLIFAVFAPRRPIPSIISRAEADGGFITKPSMEFVAERGVRDGQVPRGLYWVNQGMDAISSALATTVSDVTAGPGRGVFHANYDYLYISMLIDEIGITDEDLAQRTINFMGNEYAMALGKFRNAYPEKARPAYPGDLRLMDYYGKIQWADWETLRGDLASYYREKNPPGVWRKTLDYLHARGRSLDWERRREELEPEDMLVKRLILNTDPGTTARARSGAAGFAEGRWYSVPVNLLVGTVANIKSVFIKAVIHGLPLAQAYCLYFALAMFPIVLLISLLPVPGWPIQMLLSYFMSLFWINLWSLGMALGNSFVQIGWAAGSYLETSLLAFISAIFQLMTPIVLYMLVVRGSMGGIAAIGTAIGGLGASAAGTAQSAAGAAAGGAAKGAGG